MFYKKQTPLPQSHPFQERELSCGFTLVELIVVVTILAILATIGFVSYSSYLTGVRDTNRLAQLVSIHDGLELYRTKKDLPLPDDNVEVKIGTGAIAYQGYAGANTLETIDFTKGGQDPRDGEYFSYYLTSDRKYFQLMAFLEEEANITSQLNLVGGVNATDYSDRIPTIYGKKLGILTDISNNPIQDIPAISSAGFLTLTSANTQYIGHLTDIETLETSEILTIHPKANCKRIKQINGGSGNGLYVINPTGVSELEVYCNMTIDGGGWTLVLKADGTETTFGYSANYWTTSNTLNDTEVSNEKLEYKNDLFNTMKFSKIMLAFDSPQESNALSFNVGGNSLLSLFGGGYLQTENSRSKWLSVIEGSSLQPNCNSVGINNIGGGASVRIGILGNNEVNCASADSIIGIGITRSGSPSAGNYCTSTLCSEGQINKPLFTYLFIK